jgi:DNA-3-methyladenine glycosylase I
MGSGYCDLAPFDPWHAPYHAREYGFAIRGDARLFERLALEINQAGLSWLTILKKREAFSRAFEGFEPAVVARYGARERRRLLADAGIVRNRSKIDAVIENARRVVALTQTHGSFGAWIDAHHPRSHAQWCALFRETFRFTGGEIVREFLKSIGYLPGAHAARCPVFARIAARNPPWMRSKRKGATARRSRGARAAGGQGSAASPTASR